MATAGYSGTPLLKKLGIKEKMKVQLVSAPANYFDLLQTDISQQLCKRNELPDLIHLFVKSNLEFVSAMRHIQSYFKKNPHIIIWVSWYKKSARMPTDVTEDTIRNYALANGLVDIKVCAVNHLWSGLKLVVPLAKRSS